MGEYDLLRVFRCDKERLAGRRCWHWLSYQRSWMRLYEQLCMLYVAVSLWADFSTPSYMECNLR